MIARPNRLPLAVRRLFGAVAILAGTAAAAWLLPRLGVPLTWTRIDPATRVSFQQNWGLAAIGVAAAYLLARLIDYLAFDLGYRLRHKPPVPALLRQLIGLLVFGIGVSLILKLVLATNLAPLLTTSAVLTAVIGLALQDTLGNLFAGLALHLEKTVQEGDMVRTGETLGTVEELSWRAVKLRTLEGNVLLVPNSMAGRERLEIYPRFGPPFARTLRLALEYDASPTRARQVLEGALRGQPGLVERPEPVAYLKSFDDFAVHYELRYWLEDYSRLLELDSRVRERVWYALGRAGLRFAMPLIRQHQFAAGPLPSSSRRDAILSVISKIDLFEPLSEPERARLADGALEHRYATDEIVVREKDTGTSMFLLESGRLAVSIHGTADSSQNITVLEPGSAFGEFSLLTGSPRSATVRSLTEVALIEIDKATLAPILEANPSLVHALEETMKARQLGTARMLDAARAARAPIPEPVPLATLIARFFGLA